MTNVDQTIRSRVETFVSELSALVRQAAFQSVRDALAGEAAPVRAPVVAAPAAAPRKRGRPRKNPLPAAAPVRAPAPAAAAAPPAARPAPVAAKKPAPRGKPADSKARKKGEKRDPALLAQLVERLFDQIKANPAGRIEHINKALNVRTADLTLPIKKLLAAKRITAQGARRGTTYSPR